jgi:crotonobetainyl-CoA:carnitine CoA-transferase CaiB-like acyl-CoA transferase
MGKEETLLDSDCRVLDLCEGRGHLCGKILGDLGADVIQIERPRGDPARNIGPFYKDIPHPEKSLWWFAYNVNKRGITLNIESSDGREILKRLVERADFVIESFEPGYMEELGLEYGTLEGVNPRVIMVSLSGFGQTGPYSQYNAPDIVLMSLGGQAFMAGDDDRPPVQVSYPHAWQFAALHGCMGAMNAHYWRGLTGEGQHVDASGQTGVAWTNMNANVTWDINKIVVKRGGATRRQELMQADGKTITLTIKSTFPCKDGYVYLRLMGGTVHASRMRTLVRWMDEEGMAPEWMKDFDWEHDFDYANMNQDLLDRLYEAIEPFLMRHGKMELYEEALRRGHYLVPIGTPKSIYEDKQLAHREFWTDIAHPELKDTLTYPGWPIKQSETPWRPRRRAPLIGEHNREIYTGELGFSHGKLTMLKSAGVI